MIIPWRADGDVLRAASLVWARRRWAAVGWDVIVAEDAYAEPWAPWVKARAVQAGVADTRARVLVVADADVACEGVPWAVQAVRDGAPWAVPHDLVWRLDEPHTRLVLAGLPPERCGLDALDQPPYRGVAGGGIVVVDRDTWAEVPLDPRFEGWGGEDQAWGTALETLTGPPWRGQWRLWHLWHRPQDRLSRRTGSRESESLRLRYRRARRQPQRMRALVAEAAHNLGS